VKSNENGDQQTTNTWLRIDLLIAISALFISALTAAASLYQTHVIANQLSSSVWPYVGVTSTGDPNSLTYALKNDGMGPAIIRTVVVTLDGKPVRDLSVLVHDLAAPFSKPYPTVGMESLLPGQVLRPGDAITFLSIHGAATVQRIAKADSRVNMTVCYCSLLEECWTIDAQSATEYPHKIPRCARPGSDELQPPNPATSS
jgi:hypothetical protein